MPNMRARPTFSSSSSPLTNESNTFDPNECLTSHARPRTLDQRRRERARAAAPKEIGASSDASGLRRRSVLEERDTEESEDAREWLGAESVDSGLVFAAG